MRIVHHLTEIRRTGGGVPRSVLDLVQLLCSGDHQVKFLVASGSDLPVAWRSGEIENLGLVELDPVRPFQLLGRGGMRRAGEALRDADVLHLHGLWRPRNSQLAALARRMSKPYVLSPHGMLNYWAMAPRWAVHKTLYFRLFERRNLLAARTVHATANAEYETARRWVAKERLRVIPLVIGLGTAELPGAALFAREHPEIEPDKPRILMLGRLHPHKRPELVIEAVAAVRRAGLACQLLFAGSGDPSYLARLRRLAIRHGIGKVTHFLGIIEGTMKCSLYQFADLLALPTRRENFGLVLFECLACGTPVVTTRGADTWWQIEKSGGGRIIEPTVGALSQGIAELAADHRLRSEMGLSGQAWVAKWLDPGRLRDSYEQMYLQASDRR